MIWTVIVAKAAQKQLAKLPAKDQEKIAAAMRAMAGDPFSGDIIKLDDRAKRWRRRVGNYRIFFAADTTARTAAISAIVRRTSATY